MPKKDISQRSKSARREALREYAEEILSIFSDVAQQRRVSLTQDEWGRVESVFAKVKAVGKGFNQFELAQIPRMFEMVERFKVLDEDRFMRATEE